MEAWEYAFNERERQNEEYEDYTSEVFEAFKTLGGAVDEIEAEWDKETAKDILLEAMPEDIYDEEMENWELDEIFNHIKENNRETYVLYNIESYADDIAENQWDRR